MPIYKTKEEKTKNNKIWYFMISYTNLSGYRKRYKSKKYFTKEEASREQALFITKKEKNLKSIINFQELYLEYFNFAKTRLKERTLNINNGRIQLHVMPYFKNRKIDKITPKDIMDWQCELDKLNYSNEYKSSIYVNFSTVMNYGVKYLDLIRNPLTIVGNFKAPSEMKKEMKFWTVDEFELFIEKVDNPIYNAFFTTLFFTGLRCGEAQGLTWQDVNDTYILVNKTLTTKIKNKPYILTSPKTKKSNRIVKMTNRVKEKLFNLKKLYENYENYNNTWFVFGGINPLPEASIRRKKEKACVEAKIKIIRVHDFRHSFASLLICKGERIETISELLGHGRSSTTSDIYGHLYPHVKDDAIDKLNI